MLSPWPTTDVNQQSRTKAFIIYKAAGNFRAVQILLRHAKIESTIHYLGVDVEDAWELSERTEFDDGTASTQNLIRADQAARS